MKANRQNTYNISKRHMNKQSLHLNSRQLMFTAPQSRRTPKYTLAQLFDHHLQNEIIVRCCQNIEIILNEKAEDLYSSNKLQQGSEICLNVGSGISNMLKQCFEIYETDSQKQYVFSAIQPDTCYSAKMKRNKNSKLHFNKDQSKVYTKPLAIHKGNAKNIFQKGMYAVKQTMKQSFQSQQLCPETTDKLSVRKQKKTQCITILNLSLDQSVEKEQQSALLKLPTQKNTAVQSFSKTGKGYNKQNQKNNKNGQNMTYQKIPPKVQKEQLIIDCIADPKFSFASGRRKSLIAKQAPIKQNIMSIKGSPHLQDEIYKIKPKQMQQNALNEMGALLEIGDNASNIKEDQDSKAIQSMKPSLKNSKDGIKKVIVPQSNTLVQKMELSNLAAEHDKNMNDCISITETKNQKSNQSQFTVRYNFRFTDKKSRTQVLRISPLRFRTPLKIHGPAPSEMVAKNMP